MASLPSSMLDSTQPHCRCHYIGQAPPQQLKSSMQPARSFSPGAAVTCMAPLPHLRRVGVEGRHPRHKLVQNGPQAPPVHLVPMPCAQQQLRGQVVRGAHSSPALMAGGPHWLLALLRPASRGVHAISTRNQPEAASLGAARSDCISGGQASQGLPVPACAICSHIYTCTEARGCRQEDWRHYHIAVRGRRRLALTRGPWTDLHASSDTLRFRALLHLLKRCCADSTEQP